jgi:hypothetical protein
MKFDKQIEEFIQMRIEGKSFDEIATGLKTAKQTLIEWNKQVLVRETITTGKVIKINTTVKTFQFDLQNRLQTYLQLSKKINDELLQRDLTLINTDVLLKMSIANDSRVKELIDKNVMIGNNQSVWEIGSDQDGYFNMDLGE